MTRDWGRFRFAMAAFNVLFVLGIYLDAWSRAQVSVGPWPKLVFNAGWFASIGCLALVYARNLAVGLPWRLALPTGYHLAAVGGLIFVAGALMDDQYAQAFGLGRGMEALFAPTHMLELVGGGLMVGAPFSQALSAGARRLDWAEVTSAALVLSTLTLLTLYANPIIDLLSASGQPHIWQAKDLGTAALQGQSALLAGIVLTVAWRFSIPRGGLTVLCGLSGVLVVLIRSRFELYPVMLLTGVAADLLLLWVKRPQASVGRFYAFAAAMPAVYVLLYWAAVVGVEGGTWWPLQLWAGQVIAASLAGYLIGHILTVLASAEPGWRPRTVQPGPKITTGDVKEALQVMDDATALAKSSLGKRHGAGEGGSEAARDLRRLLTGIIRELAASAQLPDREAGRVMMEYYARRVGSHEVVMERLGLSRPTFYRRLQRGLTRVAERMDQLIEAAPAIAAGEPAAPGGIETETRLRPRVETDTETPSAPA